ncbi:ROK family protein [Streptomyces clavuligerus]|uniref:2-epi-5-epi-valiolone-7-kinase n=1 Tax=Streptomyces clavuligerus TaxID=1901 RepID=B5GMF1_STRCL|nr:ROK family protein [Streptomyces clavuligerus]ANW22366.1 tRNA-(guanine-N1)-methyltransferase [Streptomyces clavuligerus]AXU17270.1 ROK family protein [Streptomyces clavuligerus]EDY47497.1 2-epi-5-epi-valiolone 7-kinase AcbM [Streptomyces clavuligerus]EFG04457.1 2-epi-5-epi-valiolone-7-kinase [Streptomyces clavuligerus]MBY6307085.1 ROK family protein [Streptomyces clavuligerus]
MNSTDGSAGRVLCLDLGGTWFRSAVLDGNNELHLLTRTPALSVHTHAQPPEVLQELLVEHIVAAARTARTDHDCSAVAISLGAAMNGRSGLVLGSGPLWGPGRYPLPLAEILRARLPGLCVGVINDVSALAHAVRSQGGHPPGTRKAAAVTISSGIASRTIHLDRGTIPLDERHGMQGEIGHLPVPVRWRDRVLRTVCDCGGADHVSAVSSGRGIAALLNSLPEAAPFRVGDPRTTLGLFTRRVSQSDPLARELLDLFTLPLAHVLLHQATLDPEVSATYLFGGVVEGLGDPYLHSLLRNLNTLGLYEISTEDDTYFARRVFRGADDGLAALRGAGLHLRRTRVTYNP